MTRRSRLVLLVVGLVGFAAVLGIALAGVPPFGASTHPYRDLAVAGTFDHSTANAVASVNFDQRGFDTFGEETILFCAVVGVAALLRPVHRERRRKVSSGGVILESTSLLVYVLFPLTLVLGADVIAHGAITPGGGFQGGIILATGLHLLYVGGRYRLLRRLRPLEWFEQGEAAGVVLFGAIGLAGAAFGARLFSNVLPQGQLGDFVSSGTVPLFNVAVGMAVASSVVVLLAGFLDQSLAVRAAPGGPHDDKEDAA
ncbi:cation:proton antiporter [Sinomonas cyclohexanicum]|uniref:Cation:proton antiporter n=1 Tax=Sinomonas cyclohexanicum TaxID=322009 RepID=A0ABN6FDQ2_SINCY|nr:MnhB domain-containing protein [Corynebacterium cyclohexanicum]BCT74901.1 cation:proton antiporter [Corynebacterium cyclohexanicum]